MTELSLPIVFIGMPGAGKSKVGRLLAEKIGISHIDLDALIEETHQRSIAQIFATDGEDFFRAEEARLITQCLTRQCVLSLGGGAVTTPAVREALKGHTVIYIDVEHDELLRRVSGKTHRPLLADDPDAALKRLRAQRDSIYRETATTIVPSDDGPAEEVADRIFHMLTNVPQRITVNGEAPYDVLVGDVTHSDYVLPILPKDCTRVLIIHAGAVTTAAQVLADQLRESGLDVFTQSHPDAEAAKTTAVLEQMWDVAGHARLGRKDAIIAVGGGATTDMAGFVAATWLRGIAVIQIPTTLLAMVDAAVGGKTGINTASGKNLVGAFHTPLRVLVNPELLKTLPKDDLRAGAAEIIKCGFIDDEAILSIVDNCGANALTVGSPELLELIVRAITVKAQVVSADLKEAGQREFLNYGHTFAHAIERCENYRWRHGDAVAVGCVFAAELAHARGLLTEDEVARHRQLLRAVGLPTQYQGASLSALHKVMTSDKKVRAGALRFVLLDGIGHPQSVVVDPEELDTPARKIGVKCCDN